MTAVARSRHGSRSRPDHRHLGVVREEGVQPWAAVAGTFAGVGAVFLIAALFGLAIAHTMLAQGEDRMLEMETRLAAASERNRELSAEVAALEAPERVEHEAEGRLGMVRPEQVRWLVAVEPHTELDPGMMEGFTADREGATS